MKSTARALCCLVTSLFCLTAVGAGTALAVTIFPTRVVLTDKDRTAQVEIVNSGTVTESYEIRLERKRMTETGEFQPATGASLPGELFADQLVRYSPRRVTLAPGAGQTVRIMVKLSKGMAQGEYRSHLSVNRIAEASSTLPAAAPEPGSKEISISLTAYANIAVPVIVRHGTLDAALEITDLVLTPGIGKEPAVVELTLRRSGSRSVFGSLAVTAVTEDGKTEQVAAANGVAVYVPNLTRKVRLTLRGAEPPAGRVTLRATFTEQGAGKPLAETAIRVH